MDDEKLIQEYQNTLSHVRRAKRKAMGKDRQILSDMESSTEWTLEYLKLGHEPGLRRSIHRRSRIQREVLLGDMEYMAMSKSLFSGFRLSVEPEKIQKLEKALSELSDREREVFELVVGRRFSLREVAELLGISKGAVQSYFRRAKRKVIA